MLHRVYMTTSYHDQPYYRPAVEQGGRGLVDNLLGGGSSRLLMVGGMGAGMVHGGALEGGTGALEGGKTMPDLGQRAGSKPQSNEKVFVRSRAEEGGFKLSVLGCCCGCFEVWFGWRWLLVVLLDGVWSREASRLGTITVERGTGERSQRAA